MPRSIPIRIGLPALLGALALSAGAFLVVRTLDSDADAVRELFRSRLDAEAKGLAREIQASLDAAFAQARATEPWFAVSKGGTLAAPVCPQQLSSIADSKSSDPEGHFYLEQGDRESRVQGANGQLALDLWGQARAPERHPATRLAALHRLAAHARARGDRAAVQRLATSAWLSMPEEIALTIEALSLAEDALPCPSDRLTPLLQTLAGGAASEEARYWLQRIHPAALPDFDAQASRIARVQSDFEWWRNEKRTSQGCQLLENRILAWGSGDDGGVVFGSSPIPSFPPHLRLSDAASAVSTSADHLMVPMPTAIPGVLVIAESPPEEWGAERSRRRQFILVAASTLLIGGGMAAVLGIRATRSRIRAERERTQFLTQVGHDLRTPLARIRLYAETLAQGRVADPAEARAFASVAARDAESLSRRIETVLDLSRSETAAAPAQRHPVDLGDLASEVVEAHDLLLQQAKISVNGLPLPAGFRVLGDPEALKGAIQNLVENVRHHAADGGLLLLRLHREGRMVCLDVEDRGAGMPADLGDRVFDKFVRGPGAKPGGIGLGLALVRAVATSQGGRVRTSPATGGGTVVHLEIPEAEASS